MRMKEKLYKNHQKGFDRRMKILGIVSLGMLVTSAAVFIPLTQIAQANLQTQKTVNQDDKTKMAVIDDRVIELVY